MRTHLAVAPFRAALACALVSLSGCIIASTHASYSPRNSVALRTDSPTSTTRPITSLGDRQVGATTARMAALTVANAVFTSGGWQVASTNDSRAESQTEWRYVPAPSYKGDGAMSCDPSQTVGIRLRFHPIGMRGDSTQFYLSADTQIPRAIDPQQGEQLARDAFDTISESMIAGLRVAGDVPDVFSASDAMVSRSADLSTRGRRQACGTIRQP